MSITIPKKIFINNIFYLFPITLLLCWTYVSFDKDIKLARQEIRGIDLNKFVISTMQSLVLDEFIPGKLDNNLNEILKKRSYYSQDLRLHDHDFQAKEKNDLMDKNFLPMFKSLYRPSPHRDKAIAYFNEMVSYVGDSSSLILDPDLDSYYLMDLVTYAHPQILNRIEDINKELNGVKEAGFITIKNDKKFKELISVLKIVDSARFLGDMDTSLLEDVNFYGENEILQKRLKPIAPEARKSIEAYLQILETLSSEGKISFEKYRSSLNWLNFNLKQISNIGNQAMLSMLNLRISNIEKSRNEGMLIALLAVFLAAGASFYLSKLIKRDLALIVELLNDNTDEVDRTSQQNLDVGNNLYNSISEQGKAIQSISSTTEQIFQMTQKNHENVKISNEATSKTVETIEESKKLMFDLYEMIENVKNGNEQIVKRSDLNSKNFESIVTIMKDIENKTKIINDIVFQTKLLSFNASVEAARAGEQGKGFSVVAEEVGNLAQMSGQAAKDISSLLNSSLKRVQDLTIEADNEIKKVIDVSSENISSVISKVDHCQNINDKILQNSEYINHLINEVVIASEEQTKGVFLITKDISSFDQLSSRNTQLATDLNDSAKSLASKSEELRLVAENLMKMSGKE